MIVNYHGFNRRGVYEGGQLVAVDDVAEFVRARYEQGWRVLDVFASDGDFHRVGGIQDHPDTARRTWWGERP